MQPQSALQSQGSLAAFCVCVSVGESDSSAQSLSVLPWGHCKPEQAGCLFTLPAAMFIPPSHTKTTSTLNCQVFSKFFFFSVTCLMAQISTTGIKGIKVLQWEKFACNQKQKLNILWKCWIRRGKKMSISEIFTVKCCAFKNQHVQRKDLEAS